MEAVKQLTRGPRESFARGSRPEGRPIRVIEAFVDYCQNALGRPDAIPARDFLARRGFTPDRLPPVGVFTSEMDVENHLRSVGFSADDVAEFAPVTRALTPGCLVGPIMDVSGRLVTFFTCEVRSANPADATCRYYRTGESVAAGGLEVAIGQARRRDHLVLVEDLLDALLLHSEGATQVAGICDPARVVVAPRWEALSRLGVESVTLLYNSHGDARADGDAREVATRSLEASFRARRSPIVWVVDPRALRPFATVGNLTRECGLKAWTALVEKRIHGYRWKALQLIRRHRRKGKWTDAAREALLAEATAFERLVSRDETQRDIEEHFWPPLRRVLDRIVRSTPSAPPPPRAERPAADRRLLTVAECLAPHDEFLDRYRGSRWIGLTQATIPGLDEATLGFRGLVSLSGPSHGGKSALALQFAADVAANEPDACVLFGSFRLDQRDAITCLKARLTGRDWRSVTQGPDSLARTRLRWLSQNTVRPDDPETALANWGQRLVILDRVWRRKLTAKTLLRELAELKRRTGAKRGFIVIDRLKSWRLDSGPFAGPVQAEVIDDWRWREVARVRDRLDWSESIFVVGGGPGSVPVDLALTLCHRVGEKSARGGEKNQDRFVLTVANGRNGVRGASIDLFRDQATGEFRVWTERPTEIESLAPYLSSSPETDAGLGERTPVAIEHDVARRRGFTWGPYGPDSA